MEIVFFHRGNKNCANAIVRLTMAVVLPMIDQDKARPIGHT